MAKWRIHEIIKPHIIYTGDLTISIAATYLLVGEKILVVDPGAQIISIHLLKKLESFGVDRNAVEYVIITHMHGDHYFNTVFFPNAKIVASRRSVEFWRKSTTERYGEVRSKKLYELIFGGREVLFLENRENILFDGIRVILTDLHQPGHLIILVETENGLEALTGDAISMPPRLLANMLKHKQNTFEPEFSSVIKYLLENCKIIHQSHFPKILVDRLKLGRYEE